MKVFKEYPLKEKENLRLLKKLIHFYSTLIINQDTDKRKIEQIIFKLNEYLNMECIKIKIASLKTLNLLLIQLVRSGFVKKEQVVMKINQSLIENLFLLGNNKIQKIISEIFISLSLYSSDISYCIFQNSSKFLNIIIENIDIEDADIQNNLIIAISNLIIDNENIVQIVKLSGFIEKCILLRKRNLLKSINKSISIFFHNLILEFSIENVLFLKSIGLFELIIDQMKNMDIDEQFISLKSIHNILKKIEIKNNELMDFVKVLNSEEIKLKLENFEDFNNKEISEVAHEICEYLKVYHKIIH